MTFDWTKIISNVGGTGIIVGAATLILRKLIENYFSSNLEKTKHDLEKEVIKYRTRYEKLHAERAEVIKITYQKIVNTFGDFESLMRMMQWAGEPDQSQKYTTAADSFNDLSKYFHQNEIFFDQKLAEKINDLINTLMKSLMVFNTPKFIQGDKMTRDVEKWHEAWQILQNKVPEIKKEIEAQFRNILGVEL